MTTQQIEEAARLGVVFTERNGLIIATTQDGEEYYLDNTDQIDPILRDIRDRVA